MALDNDHKKFDKDGNETLNTFEQKAYDQWVADGKPAIDDNGVRVKAGNGTSPVTNYNPANPGGLVPTSPTVSMDPAIAALVNAQMPQKNTGVQIQLAGQRYVGSTLVSDTADSDQIVKDGYAKLSNQTIRDLVVSAGKKVYGDKYNRATTPDTILQYAVGVAANEGKSLSDVLAGIANNGIKGVNSGGGGTGGPFHTVNRSVQLTNEGTARRLINQTLANYLGREASDGEVQKFLGALNAQEKLNPTVTTTDGYSNGKGSTNSKSSSVGGFDAADYATRFAAAQKGAGEYKAATTYMDAFMQAIRDPNRMI